MERFKRYWMILDTAELKARAIRYLTMRPVEDGGMTPSPERRVQPRRAARKMASTTRLMDNDDWDMAGRSSDGDEWAQPEVIELTSSSSEANSSDVDMFDLE